MKAFVNDKKLYSLFRSEMGKKMSKEEDVTETKGLVSQRLIQEQIEAIIEAHRVAVASVMKEEGVKGLLKEIDDNFFIGLIEELRLTVKKQQTQKLEVVKTDSVLYSLANDLIEKMKMVPKVRESGVLPFLGIG